MIFCLSRESRLWKLIAATAVLMVVSAAPVVGQSLPACADPLSDADGDGYGWENNASCRVNVSQTTVCARNDSDSDGDGFGWENGRSCVVAEASGTIDCKLSDSDSDGDGYGWENGRSCVVGQPTEVEEKYIIQYPACSDQKYDADSDGFGWENSMTCTSLNSGDGGQSITDLVLITGQSNALGAETAFYDQASFDENLDSPVKRAYVYTNTGWSIASLRQIWDRDWYPRSDIDKNPANNFGFHFAKNVVLKDSQRVVGFILITAPGESISHWDKDQPFYSAIQQKVELALNALPHKSQVDAVLWHQGESDYYDNDYYGNKLNQLISNVRGETWVNSRAPFICGETFNSPVNRRLDALNSDSDQNTACVSSSGLSTVGDNVHFSGASMRILGARYAAKYLEILNY